MLIIAVNPSHRSGKTNKHKHWGITVLILDDKVYQIYNVCFLPAPKKRESKHRNSPERPSDSGQLYYFTRDFINQNLGI
jgi:hypothetical protein